MTTVSTYVVGYTLAADGILTVTSTGTIGNPGLYAYAGSTTVNDGLISGTNTGAIVAGAAGHAAAQLSGVGVTLTNNGTIEGGGGAMARTGGDGYTIGAVGGIGGGGGTGLVLSRRRGEPMSATISGPGDGGVGGNGGASNAEAATGGEGNAGGAGAAGAAVTAASLHQLRRD